MRCPTLTELPPPPAGKIGWPWTEESPQLPAAMPDGSPWLKVSIVTPSYNQGQFLEETIRSVLLQGYTNLEYIIMDGGSTDNSVEIIRKYEPWLAHWVSEKDGGQAYAISQGFARATGEIIAWLNSDDTYQPEAIAEAAKSLLMEPQPGGVFSNCNFVDENSNYLRLYEAANFTWSYQLLEGNSIPQPTVFMTREAYLKTGGVATELRYIMDYELWLRLHRAYGMQKKPGVWANYRLWAESHTRARPEGFRNEMLALFEKLRLDPKLPEHVQNLLPKAIASNHLWLAHWSAAQKDWASTDKYLALARKSYPQAKWPREWKKRLGNILAGKGFWAYRQKLYAEVVPSMVKACRNDPKLVNNIGVWSVSLRSLWHRYKPAKLNT